MLTLRRAAASAWPRTRVIVNTEFGRSLEESPMRGTEDGHAAALLLFGAQVISEYERLESGKQDEPVKPFRTA